VSTKVCKVSEDVEGTLIRVKVVNKTRYMLTNVKYVLNYCQKLGDGLYKIEAITPCVPPFDFIDKYSKSDENAEYAVRFSYKIPAHIRIADG